MTRGQFQWPGDRSPSWGRAWRKRLEGVRVPGEHQGWKLLKPELSQHCQPGLLCASYQLLPNKLQQNLVA